MDRYGSGRVRVGPVGTSSDVVNEWDYRRRMVAFGGN